MNTFGRAVLSSIMAASILLQACGARTLTIEPSETPVAGVTPIVRVTSTSTPTAVPEGTTLVVFSKADSGTGSLRQVLLEAEAGDRVVFEPDVFRPDNPATIFLESELPELGQGYLTIDASRAGVIIDGSGLDGAETVGLSIYSDHNTIQGLQILGFSKAGIQLHGGAQNNLIGGDPSIGSGPTGQGNLIHSQGTFGVGLWGPDTNSNTIQGNLIGTDLAGSQPMGSLAAGVFMQEAADNLVVQNVIGAFEAHGVEVCCIAQGQNTISDNWIGTDRNGNLRLAEGSEGGISIKDSAYNQVGPGNTIAYTNGVGIAVIGADSVGNHISRNSIHDNGGQGDAFLALGIELWDGGNLELAAPVLLDYDQQAGTVTGLACAGCTVELFSDRAEEGEVYEGQVLADPNGNFDFSKGTAFGGPQLTAIARDANGNTSQFSVPTPKALSRTVFLQVDNDEQRVRLQPRTSTELEENHLAGGWNLRPILELGATRASFSINAIEWNLVDWSRPEFEVEPSLDQFVTELADKGLILTNTMSFWDKANHGDGWNESRNYSRFQNEAEIERYLEFVTFNVRHFKGRVRYYELWNEPDNQGFPVQYIRIPDYERLVRQVAPVIRREDPTAKIMVGSVSNLQYSHEYLFELLNSKEIMTAVDVISWHPFYGASPSYSNSPQYGDPGDYYYHYPSMVQDIMRTAEANGFIGEYHVDEMGWPTEEVANPDQPWIYELIVAAKYYARGVVMHLGMGIITEAGAMTPAYVVPYATVQNLATVMAGAEPDRLDVQIDSQAELVRHYDFTRSDGAKLIVLWMDNAAAEVEPGVPATITLPDFPGGQVTAIDVLYGYEQPLISEEQNGELVIRDFLIKDYPIILRVEP